MVKQSMDLLELLRKRGMDGDVDLLREALRVLIGQWCEGLVAGRGVFLGGPEAGLSRRFQSERPGISAAGPVGSHGTGKFRCNVAPACRAT